MKLITTIFILICGYVGQAQNENLELRIKKYLENKRAKVGLALLHIENGDTLTIGEQNQYPMQSVYKFHLALTILKKVDQGKFTPNQKIGVSKSDLLPKTWSPMREKYPEGNADLSLREILEFTVSKSDNNGCDLLFKLIGGPKIVDTHMRDLGLKKINIAFTEDEMHRSFAAQYSNWTSPYTTVTLLKSFYDGKLLSKASSDFLMQTLIDSPTGPKRIKGLLPEGTIVAHKTGTSGSDDKGLISAVNDVGIITLPDGKHLALAIFVSQAQESEAMCEHIIAELSKMVWDSFVK